MLQRFVADPLAPPLPGADFYFDVMTMLPKVPQDVFDREALAWYRSLPEGPRPSSRCASFLALSRALAGSAAVARPLLLLAGAWRAR